MKPPHEHERDHSTVLRRKQGVMNRRCCGQSRYTRCSFESTGGMSAGSRELLKQIALASNDHLRLDLSRGGWVRCRAQWQWPSKEAKCVVYVCWDEPSAARWRVVGVR